MNELGFTPFAQRDIQFLGIRKTRDTSLKTYSVVYGSDDLDLEHFERGLGMAGKQLPSPATSSGRPGVGFVIFHQGQTGDYVVLCWWDRENELPTHVYVSDGKDWRPAKDSESFCVWDLEIISFERDKYLRTILCQSGASISKYLEETLV